MAGLRVFAVEDTAAQVCWPDLAPGSVVVAGDEHVEVGAPGPGAASLAGLLPATRYDVVVRPPGGRARRVARFTTLPSPPGEELCRFATVSDLHIGERRFGLLGTIGEDGGAGDPYPLRCARAALDEAVAWGAGAVVAKGDLTWSGRPAQWDAVATLLGGVPVPVMAVVGNHDVGRVAVDGRPALAAKGVAVGEGAFCTDLPGVRVVLAHSAVAHRSAGLVAPEESERVADLARSGGKACVVAVHHHFQRFERPVFYPAGIPAGNARAFLAAVAAANPATLVTSGHSHRHRRRHVGPLVLTEVGATLHYPGTWAGYAVHEGGIRQVVRRVAAPDAMAWTERTRRAVGGAWAAWAPGQLADRCFTHTWP